MWWKGHLPHGDRASSGVASKRQSDVLQDTDVPSGSPRSCLVKAVGLESRTVLAGEMGVVRVPRVAPLPSLRNAPPGQWWGLCCSCCPPPPPPPGVLNYLWLLQTSAQDFHFPKYSQEPLPPEICLSECSEHCSKGQEDTQEDVPRHGSIVVDNLALGDGEDDPEYPIIPAAMYTIHRCPRFKVPVYPAMPTRVMM